MDVNGAESLLWLQVCSGRRLRELIRMWRDTVGSVPSLCGSLNSFSFSFHLFHCSAGDLKVTSCPQARHYLCAPFIITVRPPINTRSCTFVSQVSWQRNKSTCDLTATKLPFVKAWMTLLPIGNEITCTAIHHKSCHSRHYYTFYTTFFVCWGVTTMSCGKLDHIMLFVYLLRTELSNDTDIQVNIVHLLKLIWSSTSCKIFFFWMKSS